MEILWRLLLGHLLADFTFQTDFINHWKRTSFKGLLAHCLMHPAFYLVLCWPYLGQTWVDFAPLGLHVNGWLCVAFVFLTHLLEDWWRVFVIQRYHVPDNTLFFLWDQAVHYAVIFAVVPLAISTVGARAIASPDIGSLIPEKWPVLACLFVLATHVNTVAVYFVEKDMRGAEFPDFEEKYLAMSGRLVLALCLLLPNAAGAVAIAAAWLLVMARLRRQRVLDLTPFSFYGGALIAAVSGLVARAVYYS
jgi:hypothetical protein